MRVEGKCFLLTISLVLITRSSCDGVTADEEYPVPAESIMNGYKPHFWETFNDPRKFSAKWVISEAKKSGVDQDVARYDGDWIIDYPKKMPIDGDQGLVFKQKAKHRAISSKLERPFVFADKPLYLQYEVLFQDTQECGGAYLKLLLEGPDGLDLKNFNDKTPYTLMFGPDKCGNSHKLHFIFRHKNPVSGVYEEKHSKGPSKRIDEFFTDGVSHLYTLIVLPDNTYQILVDHEVLVKGSLLEDFTPPVNPPAEIDDPADRKPEDWDERERIPDESAVKPDAWDEAAPRQILDAAAVKPDTWLEEEPVDIIDPSAEKPEDWDDAMDGEWEGPMVPNPACEDAAGCGPWTPPMVDNPAFKGKWTAPLIENPKYKGKWHPKKIHNPGYFEDNNPFTMTTIVSLGFELWSVSANIMFDNIVITDNEQYLQSWTDATYNKKTKINSKNADTLWTRVMVQINYKPGWWALYFIYCSIPVGIYVWYLYRRVKEDSLYSRFMDISNEYPWLWTVYTLLPLIPITLIALYCLQSKEDEKKSKPVKYSEEEDEEEEEEVSYETSEGADELDNEKNENMDGVRQRWNMSSATSEQENLRNEQLDTTESLDNGERPKSD